MAFKINPRTALMVGAVPLFLSSEDRNYLQTAMVTTPLVLAAERFGPGLFSGMSQEGSRLRDVFSRHQSINKPLVDVKAQVAAIVNSSMPNPRETKQLRQLFRKFVTTPDMNKALATATGRRWEYLSREMSEIASRQGSKRRLLSNAVQAAVRDSATPSEWGMGLLNKKTAELMSNEELYSVYETYKTRPEFVRGLSNRLRGIGWGKNGGLVDEGTFSKVGLEGPAPQVHELAVKFGQDEPDWMFKFSEEHPAVARNIQDYMRREKISQLTAIAEMNTDRSIGRILGINVGHKGKSLTIPIPDKMGRVTMPGGGVGVGRYIIGGDERPYRIDEWLTKMLAEQPRFGLQDLEKDLAQGVYFNAIDPGDSWKVAQRSNSIASGFGLSYPEQIAAKAQVATISKLPVFSGSRDYANLTAIEQAKMVGRFVESDMYSLMVSEAGVYEGRFALKNAANLHFLGSPNADKQDSTFRSISKEFRLRADSLSPDLTPRFSTTGYKAVLGVDELPRASMRVAGIAPEHRTLFADLPDNISGVRAGKQSIIDKFSKYMDIDNAEAMYGDIEATYEQGKGGVFKQFGRMGETEFWVNDDWAGNFGVENMSRYQMNEITTEAFNVDKDTVLGYMNNERVMPDAPGYKAFDSLRPDGIWESTIVHERGINGAKLDVAGIKGLAFTAEDFDLARGFMNMFHKAAGTGQHIPMNAQAMADMAYFTNKAESADVEASAAGELMRILEETGQQDLASQYKSMLSSRVAGLSYENGQLLNNHLYNPKDVKKAAARLEELAAVNEEFFQIAGRAIRNAGASSNATVQGFLNSGSNNLYNYMVQNALPAPTMAWDHTSAYVPRHVSITHDVESYMHIAGHDEALKALNARKLYYSGDKNMSLRFGHSLVNGEFGGATVPMSDAFLPGGSLGSAKARAGTILDPSIDAYKDNFRIDVGEGGRHRYIPVMGTQAYGSKGPLINPGEYQTHDWQYKLRDALNAGSAADRDAAVDELLNSYEGLYTGKTGAFRAPSFDPEAVTGFLGTKSSPNALFDVDISPDVWKRIHSKEIRDTLESGGFAHGTLLRQPISGAPFVRMRLNKNLSGHSIVADEELYRVLQGDADKDPLGIMTWRPGSEAAAEAERAISEGSQLRAIRDWQTDNGLGEISRYSRNTKLVSGAERARKVFKSVSNIAQTAKQRMVGATIGTYSNLLTDIVENMAENAEFSNGRGSRLSQNLFQIRQIPITARKASSGLFDIEDALSHLDALNTAFQDTSNDGSAAFRFQSALRKTVSTLHGEDSSLVGYIDSDEAADDLKRLFGGRTKEARLRAALYTKRGAEARNIAKMALADPMGVLGATHGGLGADMSTSSLGSMNKEIRSSARRVATSAGYEASSFIAKHGKTTAIALGSLAALGILTTPNRAPVASFDRASSNNYRPEDSIGVTDRIPGEPVTGSGSNAPPRRMVGPAPQVRTTAVAPMRDQIDLEVRTKAEDRSEGAEKAKLISRLTGRGNQNITVNYRGMSRLDSLRNRDKIRELRDNG